MACGGRVRVDTDGLSELVHKRPRLPDLDRFVDALSVSMYAHNAPIDERHCQPRPAGSDTAMLRFLAQAPSCLPEVTASAIEGLAGVDLAACESLAQESGVNFRRRTLDRVI